MVVGVYWRAGRLSHGMTEPNGNQINKFRGIGVMSVYCLFHVGLYRSNRIVIGFVSSSKFVEMRSFEHSERTRPIHKKLSGLFRVHRGGCGIPYGLRSG